MPKHRPNSGSQRNDAFANMKHSQKAPATWQHPLHEAVTANNNINQRCDDMDANQNEQHPCCDPVPPIDLLRHRVFRREHRQRHEVEIENRAAPKRRERLASED
jgi:hypothetical protein